MKIIYLHSLLLSAGGILGQRFLALPMFGRNPGIFQELQFIKRIKEWNTSIVFIVLLLAFQPYLVSQVSAQEKTADAEKIERLERLIRVQQQQLELLQQQINELKQTASDAQTEAKEAKSVAEDIESRVDQAATAKAADAEAPAEKVVTSGGGERTKLSINGFVNRMVNIVDDGKDTDAYFVDNDNAESRVNFVGTAKVNDDLTLGGRIELAIAPNKSGNVNQRDQEIDNIFSQRWTEASLLSKRFGKLSLGKGNVAAYGTASVDLSRTNLISYSFIIDTAGGMLFRQTSDDALTDVRIGDAFNNFDGLFRQNRIRYDTPAFHGFNLAASAFSDQRFDGALFWGGQGYGFKAAAGAGLTDPNEDDTGLQYGGSFSILHEDTGLNLSLSSGKLERDNQSDPYNLYGKIGWLKNFFPFGWTAFSADYTRSVNLPTDSDDGYSVGLAAVQQFEKYGTELYALYRLHSLDRDSEPGVHDISVVSIGTRISF
jgi:predicted porin